MYAKNLQIEQLENKKLAAKVDVFLSNMSRMQSNDIIQQADNLEHLIYRRIDQTLALFDSNQDVKTGIVFTDLFQEVSQLNQKLNALHNVHLHNPLLYFHAFNIELIPKDKQSHPAEYLREQYNYFMDNFLVFDKKSKQKEHIAVFVRQLLSQPTGQRLIIKLNQLAYQHGCRISVEEKNTPMLSVTPVATSGVGESAAMTDATTKPVLKFFNYPRTIWKQMQLLYPPNFWEDPRFTFQALTFGKETSLAFKPPFISIGHEFTHTLHFFRGKDRRKMAFLDSEKMYIERLFSKSIEELWTIDRGNINENKLRAEHGINPCFSHVRAGLFVDPTDELSLERIKETMSKVQSQLQESHTKSNQDKQKHTQHEKASGGFATLALQDEKPERCLVQ
ncbi:hypothetical protein FOLKNPGA_01685 [Legionella sp. PC1000]|uniref:hypothetical protein n=1 Tax=Legionella sp. PC1000 TaxID=2746060 RepID=UPI0015FC317C|nr:hypothetical protein [Legionella sp. PC1000]QLZ68905.1 hypothetical protein FOLKNPGA_01685 [Legionella sp. PC1000]